MGDPQCYYSGTLVKVSEIQYFSLFEGKSTYVRRIAYDWSILHTSTKSSNMSNDGPLSSFELLFCLNANRIDPNADLLQAITNDLPPNSDQAQVIRRVLASEPHKVLLLIDGFNGTFAPFMREVVNLKSTAMFTLRPQHLEELKGYLKGSYYQTLQLTR